MKEVSFVDRHLVVFQHTLAKCWALLPVIDVVQVSCTSVGSMGGHVDGWPSYDVL